MNRGDSILRAVSHKIYLAIQLLILIAGALWFFRVIYVSFGLVDGTIENAENCAMLAMKKDLILRQVALDNSIGWDQAIQAYVSHNKNLKSMKKEADRITKACYDYLAVDIAEGTGKVSVFIVRNGRYEPSLSWSGALLGLGFVLSVTALSSILLLVIRKWIGFVFKPEKMEGNLEKTTISEKKILPAFLLCFFFGSFGVHRFYVGKVGTGVLWIVTLGWLGIGTLIDFIMIIAGTFKDKNGLKLTEWT